MHILRYSTAMDLVRFPFPRTNEVHVVSSVAGDYEKLITGQEILAPTLEFSQVELDNTIESLQQKLGDRTVIVIISNKYKENAVIAYEYE